MFNNILDSPASDNLVVPLKILDIRATQAGADVQFQVDLRRQYYKNATIRFIVENAAALRFQGLPVQTALRPKAGGGWREVYDQDQHFQTIGHVSGNPSWQVDAQDPRRLMKTVVTASVETQFLPFLNAVYDRHLDSHDVLLEITGESHVQPGFPKIIDGIRNFGLVDLEVTKFDAIYIVPKGGPSGSAIFS
ncbi:MAG: hypothetical protein HDQ87_06910 [Clostridia bacterium]|nr:hypothetical protein [Clostridia bacterium]